MVCFLAMSDSARKCGTPPTKGELGGLSLRACIVTIVPVVEINFSSAVNGNSEFSVNDLETRRESDSGRNRLFSTPAVYH